MELNTANVTDFVMQRIDDAVASGVRPDSIVMGYDVRSLIAKSYEGARFSSIETFCGLKVLCFYRLKGKVQAFEEGTISDPTWIERL